MGFPCGGWCPRGRKAEDGGIPDHYPLVETPSAVYPQRTRQNVRDSDATLILSWGQPTGGTLLTVKACVAAGKPHLDLDPTGDLVVAFEQARKWLAETLLPGAVLNVAGPRGNGSP